MSTFMLSASQGGQVNLLALLIAVAISLATAAVSGVFVPRRILGPARVSPGEPLRNLLGITGFGLAAWSGTLFIALAWQAGPGAQSRPVTAPPQFTDVQAVVIDAVTKAAVIAALIGASIVLRPAGVRMLGVNPARFPGGLAGGILGIVIVLPLITVVDAATEWWWNYRKLEHPSAHETLLILQRHPQTWLHVLIVVSAGLLAPVAEELFFRGYFQTFLRYTFKRPWLAVLVTAELFALVHPSWMRPQILFLGICLGYAYERTGNLWVCIVMHALFNCASIAFFWHSQMGRG
jgi:membrane protease YdiL (CAAX protease family)